MRLRPFRAGDLETLFQIDKACFPPEVSYSRTELARFVGHRASKTWVATEGEIVVGFIIAYRGAGKEGHIVTIDVVESRRRAGIGSRLMDAAEEWAREQGLESISLETAEDNSVAQKFYEARAYSKVGKIEHYYGDGTAAWVLVKRLTSPGVAPKRQLTTKG
jgi:[ribosomal protein S18]-alanine N-acetyltransferase